MEKKLYRVVALIGHKSNTIFETDEFDASDNRADFEAWREARRAREQYTMKLWRDGYSVTNDGRYIHIGKKLEAGRIEIFRFIK